MKIRRLLQDLLLPLLVFGLVRSVDGFAIEGLHWSKGSKVVVHLGLGSPSVPLQDGFASWNACAADALDIWSGYLDFITVSSVSAPTVPEIPEDGINSVFFSNTVYGDALGGDTLAVTVSFQEPGPSGDGRAEADVIVNTAFHEDSYRGPLQAAASELHRVLLHEFGHLLGLDHVTFHPVGQAIMEPIISDLDHLGADDVAGMRQLYGAEITNLPDPVLPRQSQSFSYTPTANNSPISYSAAYLPPGISIDPSSGELSGTFTAGGPYETVITAHGPLADAYGTISFHVVGFDQLPGLIRILPLDVFSLVADPVRTRIYTTGTDGLKMIDTETFEVTRFLTGDQRGGLSISADASTLLSVSQISPVLKKVDLTSLKLLSSFPIPFSAGSAFEGLDDRYYLASQNSVLQLDGSTGTVEQTFATSAEERVIAMSPDKKTLFVTGEGPLSTYDISAPEPVPLLTIPGIYFAPAVSPDGSLLYLAEGGGVNSQGVGDLVQAQLPNLSPAVSFGLAFVGYSNDVTIPTGNTLYQTHIGSGHDSGEIFVYDAVTRKETMDLRLGDMSPTDDLDSPFRAEYDPLFGAALDHTGKYLFIPVNNYGYGGENELWIFSTDFASFPPAPSPPGKNLLNISTRVRVDSGQNAMIGGFIVQGDAPKKVLIRGLGPSLPISGAIGDPVLEMHDSSGEIIGTNDDWISQRVAILGSGLPPSSDREAAILMTLDPGSYTAVVRDATGQPGPSLIEVYDLDAKNSSVANISTRGQVGTGDNVMIGGFIIGGDQPAQVLVRALGPSLAGQGITLPLADPILEIHDSKGKVISTNDNWRSTEQAAIAATGIPPSNDKESAVLLTLAPGNYTAVVHGQNGMTGVGLVEVYNLDAGSSSSR